MSRPFRFKQFEIYHDECAMKVGTDGVLIGAWAAVHTAKNILDIGTGTGLIAIMAAQKNAKAHIDAIDIDKNAYLQAQKNITLCRWRHRLNVQHIALQDFLTKENKAKYDAIISNPPYFNAGTAAPMQQRQTARHTVQLTHQALARGIQYLLSDAGKCSLVLPTAEGEEFVKIATKNALHLTRQTKVRSKKNKPIERLLLEFQQQRTNTNASVVPTELIIQHEARNDWTSDYIELTGDFYLKM